MSLNGFMYKGICKLIFMFLFFIGLNMTQCAAHVCILNRIIEHALLWHRIGGRGFLFLVLGFFPYVWGFPDDRHLGTWGHRNLGLHTNPYTILLVYFFLLICRVVFVKVCVLSRHFTHPVYRCRAKRGTEG